MPRKTKFVLGILSIVVLLIALGLYTIRYLQQWYSYCGWPEVEIEQYATASHVPITVNNVDQLNRIVVMQGQGDQLRYSLAFSSDSTMLASSGEVQMPSSSSGVYCGSVWVLNLQNFEYQISHTSSDAGPIRQVAFIPDSNRLLANSKQLYLWDLNSNSELNSFSLPLDKTLRIHNQIIVYHNPQNDTIQIRNIASNRSVTMQNAYTGAVRNLAFSDNGTLVSGVEDHLVRVWDTETGHELMTLFGHSREVYGLAFSSVGNILASSGGDNTTRIWNIETSEQLQVFSGCGCTAIKFNPQGSKLAGNGRDHFYVWDVENNSIVLDLRESSITWSADFDFNPSGDLFAVDLPGATIQLRDANDGTLLTELKINILRENEASSDVIREITFSPDGQYMAVVVGSPRPSHIKDEIYLFGIPKP